MATQYSKSYSNYILRGKTFPTENGTVYENDLLTYGAPYSYVNENLTVRTEGGFTFITNTTPTTKKDYNNGIFSDRYTLNDLLDLNVGNTTDTTSIETQTAIPLNYIKLNKKYNDITKISYFGSCNTLIKSAIEDIINRFPGGLYISNNLNISGNTITLLISEFTNPFNIDLADYTYDRNIISYDLKKIATSYSDYVIVTTGDTEITYITGFTSTYSSITLNLKSPININTSFHIRPSLKKQNDFFASLDDFQTILLNRKTTPKYTSIFKIPEETSNGITYVNTKFTWQTYDGYNIDVTSMDYILFLQGLVTASNLVDEKYSDNIYRMLTHDSLKNMDNTFERIMDQDLLDEYIVGGTKIQKLLRIYGRSFDELKNYCEGISFTNNISYNKVDNLPDIYLHGKLNSLGWEGLSIENIITPTGKTSTNLFPGMGGFLTTKEVGNEFNRRLILNSKSIWKAKGTRKAIRKIFGMFGIDESVYEMREYIQQVDDYITGNTLFNILDLNQNIRSSISESLIYSPNIPTNDALYTGINVGTFVKSPSGSTNYTYTGDTATSIEYGEPFSISGNTYGYPKTRDNSNNYYFQQMGGWYRETGGLHTDINGNTYVTDITTGNNPHIGNGNYDYGTDYIDQFKNLFKNDINRQENYPIIDLTGYTNQGFPITEKSSVDNKKIRWIGNQNNEYLFNDNILIDDYGIPIVDDYGHLIYIYNTGDTVDYNLGKLTINLKNFVIGIDGDHLMDLIYSGNTSNILTDDYSVPITDNYGNLIYITENGITEQSPSGVTTQDIFNFFKTLILPYLEQVIPASTIFDFVLIDRETPKWVLTDVTCQRSGATQNFNGTTILTYKNFNYFDESSTGYTTGLTEQIIKDFGDYFSHYDTPTNDMVGYNREIRFSGDNGTCTRDTTGNWIVYSNLFNFLTTS